MKNSVVVVIATIIIFFSSTSQAEKLQTIDNRLSTVSKDEAADLTRKQLQDCMLLQRDINTQIKAIEQENLALTQIKSEIDKHLAYIEKKRSQVNRLSQEQIRHLNNSITKYKEEIATYNQKVSTINQKIDTHKTGKNSFNTNCADKSYYRNDMQVVVAEINKKANETGKSKDGKYALTVNVTPSNSRIRIMNINPKYKAGIFLKPGKYDIYVTYPNYQKYRQWIEIKDSNVTIDVVLKKK